MSSTSCRQIASPRPVPPNLRVVDESAWAKARNSRSWSPAAMPMPMSMTSKRSATRSAFSSSTETRMTTSPSEVNFTALEPRLSSTCWILTAVAEQRRGHVGMDVDQQLDPLAVGGRGEDASDVVDHARHVEVGSPRGRACRPRSWRSPRCR